MVAEKEIMHYHAALVCLDANATARAYVVCRLAIGIHLLGHAIRMNLNLIPILSGLVCCGS